MDNQSNDNTFEVAQQLLNNANTTATFKIVEEQKPGLSYARQAGFNVSQHEIVLMVDDDNWLCKDYVQIVWTAFETNSRLGMIGGQGIAAFEGSSPFWFSRYDYCYAVGPQTSVGKDAEYLYGAGLALRMNVLDAIRSAGFESLLSDRIGNSLMSGGDTELCLAFRMAGYSLEYNEAMKFQHQLPCTRLTWPYLRKLFYGFGQTKSRIDIYTSCIAGKPFPVNGRLPFWVNRGVFLGKMLIPDLGILTLSLFLQMEGNDRLLKALAKLGHLRALYQDRKDYLHLYSRVFKLKDSLSS